MHALCYIITMTAEVVADKIIKAFKSGHKLLICGNGGSAAEAQHMAGELVGKFLHQRVALPAIALTTDTSILTSVANDISFEDVFSRQVEALGMADDVLLCISTSGRSKNVLKARETAKRLGLIVLDLDMVGSETPNIQENQLRDIHLICKIVEEAFI